MEALGSEERSVLESIVAALEDAWNAADAEGFAAPFAVDGDQVNIFGTHLKNREEIAKRHAQIFSSIFRGSRSLARMSSAVAVPEGPLRGELETVASLVFRRNGPGWELVTLHNTRATGQQ